MTPAAPPEDPAARAQRGRRLRWAVCFGIGAALVVAIAVLFWRGGFQFEPRYGGRRLSQWLRNSDPDFVWLPNDVYGHIHDEFWGQLTAPSPDSSDTAGQTVAVPAAIGTKPELGLEAVPWLVIWMSERPTAMDRVVPRLLPHLPTAWYGWFSRFDDSPWTGRAGRWHVAAQEGFSLLGARASNAVPQLAPLLSNEDATLPVALSLASIGPSGISVLIHALEGTNASLRNTVALALGMSHTREAIPALIRCVERGQSSYHVLGAIGRIEPRQPGVISPLIRQLEAGESGLGTNTPALEMNEDMAVLLLGLQGPAASNAVPVLIRLHGGTLEKTTDSYRRLLRRVIRTVSPGSERRLPPPGPRDDVDDWP